MMCLGSALYQRSEMSPYLGNVLKVELMELADGLDRVGGEERNH